MTTESGTASRPSGVPSLGTVRVAEPSVAAVGCGSDPFESERGSGKVQGVIKSYDPVTGDGVVITDTALAEYDLAAGALDGSVFRMLRQGQRVVFDVDDDDRATRLRLGSEVDMRTPHFPQDDVPLDYGI